MILLKERIGKMLEYLQEQVYPKQVAIPSYKMIRTDERCLDVNNLDTSSWTEITNQELWGGHREYYWFETVVTIPEEFDGECVVYELKTGKEGEWDATNPQFSIFVNGVRVQGRNHSGRACQSRRHLSHCSFRIYRRPELQSEDELQPESTGS